MRSTRLVLACLLLGGCASLGRGPAMQLDGSLDAHEYGAIAAGVNRAATREAWWFGIANDTWSVANLYLDLGDELHVLHVSGSLGRAIYRRDGEAWQLVSGFEWTARDASIRQDGGVLAADTERLALRAAQRWTGATFRMGRDRETELLVRRDYPGIARARISLSWLSGPGEGGGGAEQAATWPAGAPVSEAVLALTRGETPARVVFDTRGWPKIDQ